MKYLKLFENFNGFKEITVTIIDDSEENCDIMFDILSNGKILDIYCYKDSVPKFYDVNYNLRPIRTKPRGNGLFLSINVNKNNISKLLSTSFPSIETMEDYDLMINVLKYYKLNLNRFNIDDWGEGIQENLITEKTIGIENIKNKYYKDVKKEHFYSIVNMDPTSVRKRGFSKPGKYTKWLLNLYRKLKEGGYDFKDKDYQVSFLENTMEVINNKDLGKAVANGYKSVYGDKIKEYLFIFSSNWYKKNEKDPSKKDILKFRDWSEFSKHIDKYVGEFKRETSNGEYELIYKDDKVSILLPINFTASYELSCGTDWCTQHNKMFDFYKQRSLLFRILPNEVTKYDKMKITWSNKECMLACSTYPEIILGESNNGHWFKSLPENFVKSISGKYNNPFLKYEGKDLWEIILNDRERHDNFDVPNKRFKYTDKTIRESMIETLSLLSQEAKDTIVNYFMKNRDKLN